MTRLEADGLSYGYSEAVVEDVSFAAAPGEVLALIGPSGTGKTTLLRTLALFDRPDAGTVRIDGRDPWTTSDDERIALRRRLGMVFQDRSLFTGSVAFNAAYGLRVRRSRLQRGRERLFSSVRWALETLPGVPAGSVLGDRAVPDAALEALDAVGMLWAGDRPARSLSAGEAQRVAFARALATDPAVLLLDEPTSNLDPRNTALIEAAIERASARGITVVLATHDMQQARRVADSVAVLLDGQCIEHGPRDRVFEDPEDERAAKFVAGELVY
ncbi:phosphate ABC transporter ATP-binding protein [Halomarina rubra]|uniref:Phosphate ABC transporter ATP-binding protein n=1 Tax=Halomarina rubra TaxID=2071873 RepID=A0ABD6AVV9_9EURY